MQTLTRSELRETQLAILREIADFCVVHGIHYYLFAGTLLGAVRHQGYIPWDDDIDIMIPRPDYERFCREFAAAPPTEYSMYSSETCRDYPFPYVKVSSDRTVLIEDTDTAIPMGVNIDIFPIDGWPDGRIAVRIHRSTILFYGWILAMKAVRPRSGRSWPKSLLLAATKRIAQRVPVTSLVDKITRRATMFSFGTSEYVGVTVWAYHERVPRGAYGKPAEVQFEDRTWPAPRDYDLVLRTIYHDYMRLPPETDRKSHHAFEAFRID